jgi:hypothetical protein
MTGLQIISAGSDHPEKVLHLFEEWSADHPELANRDLFEWQRCHRYLAVLGERVLGHIAQLPQEISIGNQTEKIGWAATLVLDESNPLMQALSGAQLLDMLINNSQLLFGAVGLVPRIESTYVRKGFSIDRDSVCMYGRFFRMKPVLEYYGKSPWLGPAIRMANIFFGARREDSNNLKAITSFDSAHDSIWNDLLSSQYDAYCHRTAEFLNYKLEQPNKDYTALLFLDNSGVPSGYSVCRLAEHPVKKLRLFKVCDLVGTATARRALLSEAIKQARSLAVDGIVGLSSRRDRSLFRGAGLWVRKPLPVVLPPERACSLHLTFFDSDLDHLW